MNIPQPGDQILINDGDSFSHVTDALGPDNETWCVIDDRDEIRYIIYISQSPDKGYEGRSLWRVKQ